MTEFEVNLDGSSLFLRSLCVYHLVPGSALLTQRAFLFRVLVLF